MNVTQLDSVQAPPPLVFTEQAALKTWELIQEEQSNALLQLWLLMLSVGRYSTMTFVWQILSQLEASIKLKVFITGGGCHGFRYDFEFTKSVELDDTVISRAIRTHTHPYQEAVVDLLVDAISLQYLRGAEIDYQSDLQGERFIIRNLKAKTTCGCGSSFAV